MVKAICLLSGGMDSLTCTAIAVNSGHEVYLLHLNYQQRTEKRELTAFNRIADFYKIPEDHRLIVDITHLHQIGGSSLTDPNIAISEADLDYDGIPSSYVPFRNAHLLAIAVSWAEVIGAHKIFVGANELDSSGYPDCRRTFYDAYMDVIYLGTKPGTDIEIVTPLINMKKKEIVEMAVKRGAPLNLSWSCYQNTGDVACGVCDSCALRLRGFREAGIEDPIRYEDDNVRTQY